MEAWTVKSRVYYFRENILRLFVKQFDRCILFVFLCSTFWKSKSGSFSIIPASDFWFFMFPFTNTFMNAFVNECNVVCEQIRCISMDKCDRCICNNEIHLQINMVNTCKTMWYSLWNVHNTQMQTQFYKHRLKW